MKMFPETSQKLSCCFVDRKSFSPSVPSLSLSPLLWLPLVPTASKRSSHTPTLILPLASLLPPEGPTLSQHLPSLLPSSLSSLMGPSQGTH